MFLKSRLIFKIFAVSVCFQTNISQIQVHIFQKVTFVTVQTFGILFLSKDKDIVRFSYLH